METLHINRFGHRLDNQVEPFEATWALVAQLLLDGHLTVSEKTQAPLFNCAFYHPVEEVKNRTGAVVFDEKTIEFHTRRRQTNIRQVEALILDFDGGLTLQQAKERFAAHEYVGYTSFSHRLDGKTDKFRLVFRLATPIPAWKEKDDHDHVIAVGEWYELTDALKDFAGPCDPASFNANQIYYVPACRSDSLPVAHAWYNDGKPLDWTTFPRHPVPQGGPAFGSAGYVSTTPRSEKTLRPDDLLQTKRGPIRVGDIQGKIEGVVCPFHDDHNGSEFVKRVPETGNVFLYCRHCGQTYFMEREADTLSTFVAAHKAIQESIAEQQPKTEEETQEELFRAVVEVSQPSPYLDATDRQRVDRHLKEIGDAIRNNRRPASPKEGSDTKKKTRTLRSAPGNHNHILFLPEGAGKSWLALDLARRGVRIVFACKSWEQAFEKLDQFQKARERFDVLSGQDTSLSVRLYASKDAKARRRFGVSVVRGKPTDPYSVGPILEEETIQRIIEANPHLSEQFIRVSWAFFSPDSLHRHAYADPTTAEEVNEPTLAGELLDLPEGTNIFITTFAQVRILTLKNEELPREWVVWFDDPDLDDVVDIAPYDPERYGELEQAELTRKTILVNKRRYHQRDVKQSLGFGVRYHKCVYTTTEQITLQALDLLLAKRGASRTVWDRMELLDGGKITILGTEKVQKRFDGIIPLIARRLEKEGFPVSLIADGLAQPLNHSNTKGKNNLTEADVVVELSIPHPDQILTICDALGAKFKTEGQRIRLDIMLDRLHQAIGRNSGYRWKGKECVVLVDRNAHKRLVRATRYRLDNDNSVQLDRTAEMSRNERRITDTASPLVQKIEHLLNHIDDYIRDGRKVIPDVDYVLGAASQDKRTAYISRLLASLTTLSGVRFDKVEEYTRERCDREQSYFRVGEHIIAKYVPADTLKKVLKEYKAIVDQ